MKEMLCGCVRKSKLGRGLCRCKGCEARHAWMVGLFKEGSGGLGQSRGQQGSRAHTGLGLSFQAGGGWGLGRVLGLRVMWPDACFKRWSCLGVPPLCSLRVHVGTRVHLDPQMEENRPDAQAGMQV